MKTMVSTRRQFLAAGVSLPFAFRAMAARGASMPRWVLLGTDKGKGIYRATWDARTGELGAVELVVEADRPDYFAMHPKLPVLYSVNALTGGKGGVSSYKVDAAAGGLTLMNKVSSHGDGPCYVSVDKTGQGAFVANYVGGSFAAYGLESDGALKAGEEVLDCQAEAACGPLGPVKARQLAAHLHCTAISPKNDFVLVCDLGDDAIQVLPIHPGGTELVGKPVRVAVRAGSGPRHVAFHPNGKWVYCIHEIDCTIDVYAWKVVGGTASMTLREGSVISTLAKGVGLAGNTACEIVVSDDGRFVYACTRGTDDITVYRVGRDGLLTEVQRLSCGGQVPRLIAFDPARKWLLCCNQGAAKDAVGSVTVFGVDARTGLLGETPKKFAAETAMCVAWV